jgi:hypothetical protein
MFMREFFLFFARAYFVTGFGLLNYHINKYDVNLNLIHFWHNKNAISRPNFTVTSKSLIQDHWRIINLK